MKLLFFSPLSIFLIFFSLFIVSSAKAQESCTYLVTYYCLHRPFHQDGDLWNSCIHSDNRQFPCPPHGGGFTNGFSCSHYNPLPQPHYTDYLCDDDDGDDNSNDDGDTTNTCPNVKVKIRGLPFQTGTVKLKCN